MSDNTAPKTHLGHWIGPAPTNIELGLEKPSKVDEQSNQEESKDDNA